MKKRSNATPKNSKRKKQKTPSNTKNNTEISNYSAQDFDTDYTTLTEQLAAEKKKNNIANITKIYILLIQNRCHLGDQSQNTKRDIAIHSYLEALEIYKDWEAESDCNIKTIWDFSTAHLTENYITQKAAIYYNLYALYIGKEDKESFNESFKMLEMAIRYYEWLESKKPDSFNKVVDKCKKEKQKLQILLEKQSYNADDSETEIDDISIYSASTSNVRDKTKTPIEDTSINSALEKQSSELISINNPSVTLIRGPEDKYKKLYEFKHASFILNYIEKNQHSQENQDTDFRLVCEDSEQAREIKQWLSNIAGLKLARSTLQIDLDENVVIVTDKTTIFNLKQWQNINNKILSALTSKDWNGFFSEVSELKTNETLKIKCNRILELIEHYYKLSTPLIINKNDLSELKSAYTNACELVNTQISKSKARRGKTKTHKEKQQSVETISVKNNPIPFSAPMPILPKNKSFTFFGSISTQQISPFVTSLPQEQQRNDTLETFAEIALGNNKPDHNKVSDDTATHNSPAILPNEIRKRASKTSG